MGRLSSLLTCFVPVHFENRKQAFVALSSRLWLIIKTHISAVALLEIVSATQTASSTTNLKIHGRKSAITVLLPSIRTSSSSRQYLKICLR